MANDWTKNPMVIDTVENNAGAYFLDRFEFHPAAAGNDLEIQDGAGNVLYKTRAIAAAPDSVAIENSARFCRPVYGINVATIDGGTLYVHIR